MTDELHLDDLAVAQLTALAGAMRLTPSQVLAQLVEREALAVARCRFMLFAVPVACSCPDHHARRTSVRC